MDGEGARSRGRAPNAQSVNLPPTETGSGTSLESPETTGPAVPPRRPRPGRGFPRSSRIRRDQLADTLEQEGNPDDSLPRSTYVMRSIREEFQRPGTPEGRVRQRRLRPGFSRVAMAFRVLIDSSYTLYTNEWREYLLHRLPQRMKHLACCKNRKEHCYEDPHVEQPEIVYEVPRRWWGLGVLGFERRLVAAMLSDIGLVPRIPYQAVGVGLWGDLKLYYELIPEDRTTMPPSSELL